MLDDRSVPGAEDPLLDSAEAAEYLDVSKSWIEKQRCHGTGPSFVKIGGKVRYRKHADLDRYKRLRVVETTDTRRAAA